MVAAVSAGHPATAEAGVEILAEGGSAADAAVAAALASCVAETVMTGVLGGGHAIVWDGRRARNLDCFVAVPSGSANTSFLTRPSVKMETGTANLRIGRRLGCSSCGTSSRGRRIGQWHTG